jgi:hypothetical protein
VPELAPPLDAPLPAQAVAPQAPATRRTIAVGHLTRRILELDPEVMPR